MLALISILSLADEKWSPLSLYLTSPENLKASKPGNQWAKTCLKESMEVEIVTLLPALVLNLSPCAHDAWDWHTGPRSLKVLPNQSYGFPSSITCCGTCSQAAGASPRALDRIPIDLGKKQSDPKLAG